MSTGKLINWKIESESESCEIQISLSKMFIESESCTLQINLSKMFCTLSFYRCKVHDELQMFLLAGVGDSCLKASIFLFAVPNIIVCTLEHSCLQV